LSESVNRFERARKAYLQEFWLAMLESHLTGFDADSEALVTAEKTDNLIFLHEAAKGARGGVGDAS
jgi:hypothetical protein